VFFNCEGSWIYTDPEDGPIGKPGCSGATHGKRKELSNNAGDRYRWISEEKELVKARDDDSPNHSYDPCTNGRDWHGGIISIGDGGSHFGVGALILER